MGSTDRTRAETVIYTVADALDEDPVDLPPLERTISADALNALFREKNQPADAYTLFPYCDLWVVVHSDGTVDVFKEYAATSAGRKLPADVPEPSADERLVLLYVGGEEYTFYEDELERLHEIISDAEGSEEAWEKTIEYAKQ